jgi:DNA-binding transcriptional MerR regulator
MTDLKTKVCSKCNEDKPLEKFSKGRSNGYHVWCKSCLSIYAKTVKDRKGDDYHKRIHYLRKYNMTFEEVKELLDSQNGSCALCQTSVSFGTGFSNAAHVDHCHTTNKVRGILCGNCNTALGKLGDSVESIKKVLQYLEKE